MSQEQRTYFESPTNSDYALMGVILILNLVAAILLFMLRRAALYVFVVSFAASLLLTIYNIACKNWLAGAGPTGIISAVFGWGVAIAIICYVWQLSRKGVLR